MHAVWACHQLDMLAYTLAPYARIIASHVLGFPSLEKGAQPIDCLVLYKVRGCCLVGFSYSPTYTDQVYDTNLCCIKLNRSMMKHQQKSG